MQKSYVSEKGFRKGGNAFLVVAAVLAILKAMEYVSSDRWMAGAMIAVVALICVVTLVRRYHTA